jgi:hypothetical protein
VNPPTARTAAVAIVIAAVAVAGCGGVETRPEPVAQAPVGPGTDLVPLTTAQAARIADRIALVVAGPSRVVEGMPGTPFTRTRFDVQDVVKGKLPRRFSLQVIGGRLGDRFVTSPLQPFTPSRRYVLFLGPDGRNGPTIIPQAVIDVTGTKPGRLLAEIQRSLSTEGSP